MSTTCTILFDNNPNGVYYAGQNISGTAQIITSRPKTIRSIHLTINGYAEVRWTKSVQKANQEGKNESVEEVYSATDHYVHSQTYVYGQSGGGSLELPAGKYLFTFNGFIPPNVPTSLNGSLGQIRYEIVLTIDRPLRYDNVFKQPFTIISPLDLNLNQAYSLPMDKKEQKEFLCGFCCGNNDPILVKVFIPFSGYAPGQKINFRVNVDNKSNTDCSEVKLKLMKTVKFTCRTPATENRENSTKVCDKRLESIPKQESREFVDFLRIPSTTPSTLESCSIIHVTYTLIVVTKFAGLHNSLNMTFPFTIGTVPLYASVNEQENGIITGQPGGPQIGTIAPPSFEDDVDRKNIFQNNDISNKFMKNVDYVPKYPVFYTMSQGQGGVNPNQPNPNSPYPANTLYPGAPNLNPSPQHSPYPVRGIQPGPNPPVNPPYPSHPGGARQNVNAPSAPSSPPYPPEPAGVIWSDGPNNANSNSLGWRS